MTPLTEKIDAQSDIRHLLNFYDERGYDQRIGKGKRPAIIVIDFSNAFTVGLGGFPGGNFSKELDATLIMLKRARALEIPIFYTTIAYTDPTKEAGLWGVKVPWLYHCQFGSTAVEIDARLEARPNEPVIVKKFPSALFQTDLLSRLNQLRIDTVLIAGCTTSVCIHATAIDMMQHGFKPLMVAEAIGEFDQQLHALSLKDLDSRYGDVISIHDALSYLSALKEEGNKLL